MTTDVRVNMNSSYVQSFAVNKLLATPAPKPQWLQSITSWLVLTCRLIGR